MGRSQNERFALVISNNSGEGGASLVRRRFGEAIHHSVSMVPYWYCARYGRYAWHEADLPLDAHMLISLIAQRPVYVASAAKGLWADPRGEFLAAKHAEPVYQLLGRAGLDVADMPPADHPVGDFIGYHVRTGKHQSLPDWSVRHLPADRCCSCWSVSCRASRCTKRTVEVSIEQADHAGAPVATTGIQRLLTGSFSAPLVVC